ncbi:nucleotidyltransferase domain-containing protein [Actinoplanes missouriensis]|uniref:nucleotidyltransferase domain-containing protein n=1 Tax=Actinoplanes missouriensis TaxID=1866 RepID=UPI000686B200|nr:aminoglycoside adenylyltransferase [Actinoplanes missouriensis]
MNTERTDPGTQRQLTAIAEVAALDIPVWLRGGWAMDFFLGRVTRPHRDVDWFAMAADAGRVVAALTARGWERVPHDHQLEFLRDGVELSFALLAADLTVAAGPWTGESWPAGMLDWPACRLGDVTCAVVSPYAQIEIKKSMPVWVPGLPRRPKDAEDVALLEAALRQRRDPPGTAAASRPGPA